MWLLQVQALPPAAASVGHCDSYLQTTATLKPGWLTSLQSQQRPDGFLHQAQAAALHTHIPPAISPAPHTLHPAAPESLNCMQQPRKHSRMFIDSKESAQSAQAGHEHTTFSWKDYNHYLQAAAMQAAMSSKQSGPVPAVLDQTQFRQHAAVPAAVTRRTHYQQQQLQAAAVAALYNAAHLHPEMLQPHFSTHAAESRSSQLTSAASVQNIRGRSAQTHQGHHHHDAALVAQQQTVYAPEVSALEHALGMHFMPQARPNQMRGTNPALMEHQPMPHSQYPTQFSAVSYDNLAGCPNDFLHRKQNTSLQSRQDAFLQAAYAQGRLGSNQLTRRDL